MMIHDITAMAGKYKARKRLGRGPGSGTGKTAGRGHKGARARSGYSARLQFEGGQMPFFRRIAKRGFTNVQFKTNFWIVNLRDIVAHPDFAKGGKVTAESLAKAGLIRDDKRPVKVLGDMGQSDKIKARLEVDVARVSGSAKKAISDAGGSVNESGSRRDQVRGIDRNSDDQTPRSLNKKPKRRAAKKFD